MVKSQFRYYTYKVTFKDLPGYFYYGKKKDMGKPYLGSPKTWKHLWSQFEPEVQILQWYRTEEEVKRAEDSLIKATWRQVWGGKRYSLNENVGGMVSEEICRRNGKRNVTQRKGVHSPNYLGSEKHLESSRRGGKTTVERRSGFLSEKYRSSAKYHEDRVKSGKKKSKPVRCLETGEVFPSAKEAGVAMKRNYSNIAACCRGIREKCAGLHWEFV